MNLEEERVPRRYESRFARHKNDKIKARKRIDINVHFSSHTPQSPIPHASTDWSTNHPNPPTKPLYVAFYCTLQDRQGSK